MNKSLDVVDGETLREKVKDVVVKGDPDTWRLVCKVSSAEQGWMKSTKAMDIGRGVLVQVTTQQGQNIAEAICFVPDGELMINENGTCNIDV